MKTKNTWLLEFNFSELSQFRLDCVSRIDKIRLVQSGKVSLKTNTKIEIKNHVYFFFVFIYCTTKGFRIKNARIIHTGN